MVYRLVFENLKHRPIRTSLSVFLIGFQVTLILTLVGLSKGMLGDFGTSRRGTGADIMMRAPNSSLLSFSIKMPEKFVAKVREVPHVGRVTGTLMQPLDSLGSSIAGIHLDEFNAMSGGLKYLRGGPFQHPDDVIIDDVFARSKHAGVGDTLDLNGVKWHVCGIVESGKMSRAFADIRQLQDLYSAPNSVTVIWIKADSPANIPAALDALMAAFPDNNIVDMEQYISLLSPDAIPMLTPFTRVVIGVAIVVGFAVVFLSMYTAVLERTREIGILKALGASPGYILGILLRETVLLAIAGGIAGIVMSYGTQWLMKMLAPTMTVLIVYPWWPVAGAIAMVGAIGGAIYPGLKAARQDAIEALSYD